MLKRIISGTVLAILLLLVIIFGGSVMWAFTLLISVIAYGELTAALGIHEKEKRINAPEIIGIVTILLYYAGILLDAGSEVIQFILVISVIVTLGVYVFTFPRFDWKAIAGNVFALLYAPFMLSFIYLTRERFQNGALLVVLIFVGSWISDTCAYFVGVAIGKHKLAPVLSPKKSIEGSIGGIVGAALIGALYAFILSHLGLGYASMREVIIFAILGGVGSVISQIGDLAASAIKRQVDIKDYGTLIPGHGGIMDRFDSVIVTAPLVYFLAGFLLK